MRDEVPKKLGDAYPEVANFFDSLGLKDDLEVLYSIAPDICEEWFPLGKFSQEDLANVSASQVELAKNIITFAVLASNTLKSTASEDTLRNIENEWYSFYYPNRDEICDSSLTFDLDLFLCHDALHEIHRRRITLAIISSVEVYSSKIPRELPLFFFEHFMGQSLQGFLAASKSISDTPEFIDHLGGKLVLAYPGSGTHMTPLLMGFDLIDRGIVENAEFHYVDIQLDRKKIFLEKLILLEESGYITGLDVKQLDESKSIFTMLYHGKFVKFIFTSADAYDFQLWLPQEPNLLIDHLPFDSASAGSGIHLMQSYFEENRCRVLCVSPSDRLRVQDTVGDALLSVSRIPNVAFANKGTWTLPDETSIGMTLSLVDYSKSIESLT